MSAPFLRPPTVYVDPGVTDNVGWCVAVNGRMISAGKCLRENYRLDVVYGEAIMCKRAVVERPWGVGAIGAGKKGSTRKDIDELLIAAGEFAGPFGTKVYLYPYALEKSLRHERALEGLMPSELKLLPKQITYRKHTLCAVYMFLRDVGRIVA